MRPIVLLSRSDYSESSQKLLQSVAHSFQFREKKMRLSEQGIIENQTILSFLQEENSAEDILLSSFKDINQWIESADIAMLVLDYQTVDDITFYLNLCREIRIPYIFVHPLHEIAFEVVGVPVTYLIEEKEKMPFAAAFGRFCNSKILLFEPQKDYGSKARATLDAMQRFFNQFSFDSERCSVAKDSYSIEKFITKQVKDYSLNLLMLMASRSYGLDDLILGPKEKRLIRKSSVPVLLLNPRGDLYALCD